MDSNHDIVTIIQARTSSSRLPGKILLEACGKTILSLMIERVSRSKLAGKIIVATTTDIADDIIVELCKEENKICFRGHPYDLLDRHYKAAMEFGASSVVKVPSDCPLIDPKIIDKVIGFYLENQGRYDFVSNLHPASYPDGNDVEIFSMNALKEAWRESSKNYEREHTTPFIWDNPKRFKIGNVKWDSGLDFSISHRWTLDYFEDFLFIRTVFEKLYTSNPYFGLDDIIELCWNNPELMTTNQKFRGSNWIMHYLDDLKTIKRDFVF